jgi:hypothetical protein
MEDQMRKVGMFIVGFLIVGAKLAHSAHALYSFERVSVATYNYVAGHHAHKDGR